MVFYWDAGLLNTEKNIFDENTYSGISISNNKEILKTVSFPWQHKRQARKL